MMQNRQRIGIVILLLIAVVAVAQMKPSGTTDATAESHQAVPLASAADGAGIPRLLDLGSTSCVPCKMMAPILDALKKEHAGKLQVDFIDVWQDRAAGEKYGVEAIPTQIFFDASGKELYRHTGFYAKEDILAKLKELGIRL